MQSYHLEFEVSGCNNEVAALQSDHYTEILLYWCYSDFENERLRQLNESTQNFFILVFFFCTCHLPGGGTRNLLCCYGGADIIWHF